MAIARERERIETWKLADRISRVFPNRRDNRYEIIERFERRARLALARRRSRFRREIFVGALSELRFSVNASLREQTSVRRDAHAARRPLIRPLDRKWKRRRPYSDVPCPPAALPPCAPFGPHNPINVIRILSGNCYRVVRGPLDKRAGEPIRSTDRSP